MKCTIPEISWHNREPVLSVHIHPVREKFYRLVSGGADCHVLIWQLNICENGAVKIEALSDLTRHQRAVNAVRWSPDGQYLATADDDANIIIWQLKTDNIPLLEGEGNDKDKEIWSVHKVMRGHKEDIYDVCWSSNSQKLLSGSIDNTAILWDFAKGKSQNILTDHKGFVQGVSWDPKNHYIATISTDRICRIYESTAKHIKARIQKGVLPVPKDHYLYNKEVKFFHDDTFKSFFRRLDFSPDGSLLAVPSGRVQIEDSKKIFNATYIFAVDNWTEPVVVFPSGKQCSTVVRFCPLLFEHHEDGPVSIISLPFRMIFAIGTDHDIILYDTQQTAPFAYFKDIHYTRLTDLTWSQDGRLLVASSTDGFCALITFEPEELGVPYVKEESEVEDNCILNISGCEELVDKEDNFNVSKEKIDVKPKKPNLLEKWTIKTPKKLRNSRSDEGTYKKISETDLNKSENETNKRKLENGDKDISVTPKRIKPLPVSTDKEKDNEANLISTKKKEKMSPLVRFLKGGKSKSEEIKKEKRTVSLSPAELILDENEARDAFPSNIKEQNKNPDSENKIVVNVEEYTEEFSLHLEDTNTQESCKTELEDTVKFVERENNEKNAELEPINEKEIENKKDVIKTVQNTDKTKDCPISEKLKNQVENIAENKILTKRRIPLITLSSPKYKKK